MSTYRDVIPSVKAISNPTQNTLGVDGARRGASNALYSKAFNADARGAIDASRIQADSNIKIDQIKHNQFISDVGNLAAPLMEWMKAETDDNAHRRGLEQAQNDLAIISTLQESRKAKKLEIDRVTQEYLNRGEEGVFGSVEETLGKYNNDVAFLEDSIAQDDEKIKQLLSKGSAYSIQENARANQLNDMFLQKIDLDTSNTLEELYNAHKNNPVALETQANKLLGAIKQVPEQFKESIRINMKANIARTVSKAKDNLKKKQIDEISAVRNQALAYQTNVATQDAFDGKDVGAILKKVHGFYDAGIKDGTISEVDAKNALIDLRLQVSINKELGAASRILNDQSLKPEVRIKNLMQYAENFKNKTHFEMDNNTKMSTYKQMLTSAKNLASSIKSAKNVQNKADKAWYKAVADRIKTGKIEVNGVDMEKAHRLSIKYGEGDKFRLLENQYHALQHLSSLDVDAQKNEIETMAAEIQGMEARGESTFDALTMFNVLKTQVQKNIEAAQKDPNAYSAKHPILVDGEYIKSNNISQIHPIQTEDGLDYNAYNKGIVGELSKRWHNRFAYTSGLGKYETISTNEAHSLQQNYDQMSSKDKFNFLSQMSNNLGYVEANNVFKQMFKDNKSSDLVAANIYSYGTNNDKNTATFMIKGQERRRTKEFQKLPTSEANDLKMAITSAISGKVPNTALYSEAVMNYYYGKSNSFEGYDDDLMEEAVTNVIGVIDDYNDVELPQPEEGYLGKFIQQVTQPNNNYLQEVPDSYSSLEEFKHDLGSVKKSNYFSADEMKWSLEFRGKGKYYLKTGNQYMMLRGKPYVLDIYKQVDENSPKVLYNVNR